MVASSPRSVRIGCGAGMDTDRPDLALQMVVEGDVGYVCFDNLAERTLAFAQLARMEDPAAGFNVLLRVRMRLLLREAMARGIKLLGNMGAANPPGAGAAVLEEAERLGIEDITVAVVTGDDVRDLVVSGELDLTFWETGGGIESLPGEIVSANAYTGAGPMLEALREGADVVVAGRCSDLSPYVAALCHEFDWSLDDVDRVAVAAMVGHFLECGRWITGGAYADPYFGKVVPRLEDLSLPLATVTADGGITVSKVADSGGLLTVDTCKEQLVHEVHDPSSYMSPDVILDVTQVELRQIADDAVAVTGVRGRRRSDTYKALVGVREGWIAEGAVSFAGAGALEKAELATNLVERRLRCMGHEFSDYRTDLVGLNSVHGAATPTSDHVPYEVRLRIAGRTATLEPAHALVAEFENLWAGPVGAGGVRTEVRPVIGMYSTLVPRHCVPLSLTTTRRTSRRARA